MKKVRCTCLRCGKVDRLDAAATDTTEPYLCSRCDGAFIAWQNAAEATADEKRRTLEAFLALRPQR